MISEDLMRELEIKKTANPVKNLSDLKNSEIIVLVNDTVNRFHINSSVLYKYNVKYSFHIPIFRVKFKINLLITKCGYEKPPYTIMQPGIKLF